MSKNTNKSTSTTATLASDTLRNPNSSKTAKSLAGSVLAQAHTKKQTSSEMEDVASQVLNSPKYSEDTKSLAGSVLSQSNEDR